MASRRIYLTLAAILRGGATPIDENLYRHSWLSQGLRLSVIEAEIAHASRMSYSVAIAALYGNSAVDVEKGCEHVNKLHTSAMASIPYFTPKTTNPAVDERTAGIEAWRRMQAEDEKEQS